MFRHLCLSVLLFFGFFSLQAQIILTANDFPNAGETIFNVNATAGAGTTVGSPGANQTYDFSALTPVDTTSISFVDPAGTDGASAFPEATLALAEAEGIIYLRETSTEAVLLGLYADTTENGTGEFVSVRFDPTQKFFEFPSTFNTAYTDTWGLSGAIEDPSGFADSIRNTTTVTRDVLFDGYGTIITPDGSFQGLRERSYSVTNSVTEAYVGGAWVPVFNTETRDTAYNWYAKENGGPLVSVEIENGVIASVFYSIAAAVVLPPTAAFTVSNLGDGVFSFTDQSTNAPDSWSWNFGDGNTSTDQNPQHTFTEAGTYNVCLTVTNSEGSNTSCTEVEVILAPVAAFSFTDQGEGVVDFEDTSDNAPTGWAWDFGDGNTSTDQNPQHTFAAPGTFNVCLTATNEAGANTACQEISIMITSVAEIDYLTRTLLAPNPVRGRLQLRLESSAQERLIFRLVDPGGQVLLRAPVRTNADHYFDLRDLPSGIYFYQISDERGALGSRGSLLKVDQ